MILESVLVLAGVVAAGPRAAGVVSPAVVSAAGATGATGGHRTLVPAIAGQEQQGNQSKHAHLIDADAREPSRFRSSLAAELFAKDGLCEAPPALDRTHRGVEGRSGLGVVLLVGW